MRRLVLTASAGLAACSGGPGTPHETGVDAAADADAGLPVLVTVTRYPDEWLSNLARAPLQLDDSGCLRFGGHYAIWHPDSRIERAPDGRIAIVEGVAGQTVHVGEEIGTSGVEQVAPPPPEGLDVPVPPACARGTFFVLGPIVTAAQLREQDRRQATRIPVPAPPVR